MSKWRAFTGREESLLRLLLDQQFPGAEVLRMQVLAAETRARTLDVDGSIALKVPENFPAAAVTQRVPIEAETADHDGDGVHALLHVVQGRAVELELYRNNGEPVEEWPSLSSWQVIVP
jgi:hypothetical protein